ncbi:MAG: DUF421 domain-containing protein [Dehalococcoidia bacterium]|nr:DUF421 domain-containing protein [Dehalococcoidia bacterium]
MFDLGTPWWEILIRTGVVYVAVLFGLRASGKRQIGQMTPFDLVLILLIANAVQNAMVGPDASLVGGLLAAAVLLLANWAVSVIRHRSAHFRDVVEGEPALLISDGTLLQREIDRQEIDRTELEEAIREHGIASIDDVKMAVLEVDGTISIVPRESQTVRTHRRFRQRRHQN